MSAQPGARRRPTSGSAGHTNVSWLNLIEPFFSFLRKPPYTTIPGDRVWGIRAIPFRPTAEGDGLTQSSFSRSRSDFRTPQSARNDFHFPFLLGRACATTIWFWQSYSGGGNPFYSVLAGGRLRERFWHTLAGAAYGPDVHAECLGDLPPACAGRPHHPGLHAVEHDARTPDCGTALRSTCAGVPEPLDAVTVGALIDLVVAAQPSVI